MADARARYTVKWLIDPWSQPTCGAISEMETAAETARELGDLDYWIRARHSRVTLVALCGEPLAKVNSLLADQRDQPISELMAYVYDLLQRESVDASTVARTLADCLDRLGSERVYVTDHVVAVFCIMGEYALGAEVLSRLWQQVCLTRVLGSRVVDCTFYRGPASAASPGPSPGTGWIHQRRRAHVLSTCIRKLRRSSRQGPDFVHMYDLLRAEKLRGPRRAHRAHSALD